MSIRRIAVVFDNTRRPETTGFYCRRALAELVSLGKLAEVEHLLPEELDRVQRGEFDLFLAIDDGLSYSWPKPLRPTAWWAIDTHLDFSRTLERAWQSDFVFAAQRSGAERLRREGISGAAWLPLACDPRIHQRYDVMQQLDIAFVGHEIPGERTRLLDLLRDRFPNHFIGQSYGKAMAAIYSSARMGFNRSVKDDINMRVFEVPACGAFLLTNDLTENGQSELLTLGQHIETYQSDEELLDKARFYLANDERRERIARAGSAHVRSCHTYRHRMETLLHRVENSKKSQFVSVPECIPSNKAPSSPPSKDPLYFEFARPEILELIPRTAKRVLDVGCGAGRLGAALKQRQNVEVIGIERHSAAALRARNVLDAVSEIDLTEDQAEYPSGPFDVIVCADILEHLPQPRSVLERLQSLLTPDGIVVASLPNVQHHSVVRSLLAGNFTYEPAGILDEDHKRFFTRREMEKLFYRAGLTVEHVRFAPDAAHQQWLSEGRPPTLQLGSLQIQSESPDEIEPFYVYQYLLVARPTPAPAWGLTSIILVTHNQWDYTRLCLESLRFVTDELYELIVVDNASTDQTLPWLRSQPDIRLIENPENRGYPAAVNQGLAVAQGKQILLLNNDTLLTTGWLGRLLGALHRDSRIGLAGPCSNHVSGPQQIAVNYQSITELDGFAWDYTRRQAVRSMETDRLVGFCLLIRREVIERIGTLDERFGIGCYEDDDFCRRAIQAGFRCVIAQDAFVHHFGSRTFLGSGQDLGQILEANQKIYDAKWETDSRHSASLEPEISPYRPRLSLCMIVRDNEQTIRPCLESIRPWVDEMIIVDTGSTDRTPKICEELGARVEHFPWCDDFSAARNESLHYASGEWIFWMDSDDTIPAECGRKLRELANGDHSPKISGYVMQVHCPSGPDASPQDVTIVDHVKLFRNRPELRFEHRIHEQILPAIRRRGGKVEFTDIYVVHSGSEHTEEAHQRKLERDFRILRLDLAERPNHPFVLFNLGMTHADAGNHEEAANCLKNSIEVSSPGDSHLHKAYSLLIGSLTRLEHWKEAESQCRRGLELFPQDTELWFRFGIVLHHLGQLSEAVEAYQQVLHPPEDRYFNSMDAGIANYKTRHNLALVYQEMEDWSRAEAEWRRVVADQPDYPAAWEALGELLLKTGRMEEAVQIARTLYQRPHLFHIGTMLEAELSVQRGEAAAAAEILMRAYERRSDVNVLQKLCRIQFEWLGPLAAETSLSELAERVPDDASVWHNLGTIRRLQGRFPEAIENYERSLKLRAHSPDTLVELASALYEHGCLDQAIIACQQALEHSFNHAGAKRLLQQLENTTAKEENSTD